jgi:predicted nucleic acid-binding protein
MKKSRRKIPDAIIAATAKVKGSTLVTADKSLTQKLRELAIISPI